jgi:lipopolysaccharide transport system ATP-binding protein
MQELVGQGRTVLFVSHNLPAVLHLCTRAVLLDGGEVIMDAEPSTVVDHYLQRMEEAAGVSLGHRTDRQGNQRFRFVDYAIADARDRRPLPRVRSGQQVDIILDYASHGDDSLHHLHVAVGVYGPHGDKLLQLSSLLTADDFAQLPPEGSLVCTVPRWPLAPGQYRFNVWASLDGELADWVQGVGTIEVEPGDFYGSGQLPPPGQGCLLVEHRWHAEQPHGGGRTRPC